MRSLGDAQAALLELEGRVAAEAGERDRLVDLRFGLLSDALGTINADLSQARMWGVKGWARVSGVPSEFQLGLLGGAHKYMVPRTSTGAAIGA